MSREELVTGTVLEKIKSRGYWEVILRPTRFEAERITLPDCLRIVEECNVRLRGWDYPHISRREPPRVRGVDYVESLTDWAGYKEIWRMYQSGQFVHLFGCREDWLGEDIPLFGKSPYSDIKPGTILEVIMTVYTVSEIYEFATRIAQKAVLDETIFLSIVLHGMKERKLAFLEPGRSLYDEYASHIADIKKENNIAVEKLLANGRELSLDHAIWIFERFNWSRPPKEILKEEQRKLLEGKFR